MPEVSLPGGEHKSLTADAIIDDAFDLAVVLVASPRWPLGQIATAGIPVFDAVNAAGPPGDATDHERL